MLRSKLQSYILSTTTETLLVIASRLAPRGFNRTSFQQQLKLRIERAATAGSVLQSYILSTTNETLQRSLSVQNENCFNRTSFQQQLKQVMDAGKESIKQASIVHPFNNN